MRADTLQRLLNSWCLIELHQASLKKIPIIVVKILNGGFDYAEARSFVLNLEQEMTRLNPSGLNLLHEHFGSDLSELASVCTEVLDASDGGSIVFDPHAGDNVMIATMKDVIEKMAESIRLEVVWKGVDKSFTSFENNFRKMTKTKSGGSQLFRKKTIMIREKTKQSRCMSLMLEDLQSSKLSAFGALGPLGAGKMLSKLRRSDSNKRSTTPKDVEVRNEESAVFVCCSRRDAVSHARVLRGELALRLNRGCAVGGGIDSSTFIADSEAFVVLLTQSRKPSASQTHNNTCDNRRT